MKRIILIISFLVFCICVRGEEEITLTNYYPSPTGAYGDLKCKKVWIGTDPNGNLLTGGSPFLQAGGTIDANGGIYGLSDLQIDNIFGVRGEASNGGKIKTYGVYGETKAWGTDASGVAGYATNSTGRVYGVYGCTSSTGDYSAGVKGEANGNGSVYGVHGLASYTSSIGVYGENKSATGVSYAIMGETSSNQGRAIVGVATSEGGNSTIGIWGESCSNSDMSCGVYGVASATSGVTYGVWGDTSSPQGYAGYFRGKVKTTGGLEIGGQLTVTGAVVAGGTQDTLGANAVKNIFDVAELIPCSKDVEYSDVVVINPDKDREATKCTKEEQSAAGIISENPQFSMGDREGIREKEPENNWNFLALAGQVYCKVDASYGEIKRGDLLTTSPTPGHAMKAKPICEINGHSIYPQGCIVGKALEPLKEGKGKILVLVCLM